MASQSSPTPPRGVNTDDTLHQTFNFDHLPIRTVDRDGEVWFVAADVCAALSLPETHKAVARLDEDEKGRNLIPTPGGRQEMTVVNEPGLYALIMTSRKDEAKRFKRWVTREVLPSIRKTGGYQHQTVDRSQLALALATEVAASAARAVFQAVMAEDWSIIPSRWLFSLTYDGNNNPTIPFVRAVDRDAMIVSIDDLPNQLLKPNGMLASDRELARLAVACNQRLSERMDREATKPAAQAGVKVTQQITHSTAL